MEAAFDRHDHDHSHCIADAVSAAERICFENGARLTETRRRILELIWAERRPVGAYRLLDELSAERGRVAPPTVYRALDFLMEQGLIHRIESLNAFVGCHHPREWHAGHFLICRTCGATAEMIDEEVDRALVDGASRLGFMVERPMVEVTGLCPTCRAADVG